MGGGIALNTIIGACVVAIMGVLQLRLRGQPLSKVVRTVKQLWACVALRGQHRDINISEAQP
jgi:hypothetical protein